MIFISPGPISEIRSDLIVRARGFTTITSDSSYASDSYFTSKASGSDSKIRSYSRHWTRAQAIAGSSRARACLKNRPLDSGLAQKSYGKLSLENRLAQKLVINLLLVNSLARIWLQLLRNGKMKTELLQTFLTTYDCCMLVSMINYIFGDK